MAFNILIVDDSEIIRKMIARTLELAGVPVGELYTAGNGAEALELVERHWIDLILADINMPVMNGMRMIDAMARDQITASIPVIVVSTEGSETKIEKMRKQGIKAFVRKPFSPETIRETIIHIMGEWEDGTETPREYSEDTF